jgi:hypothetical protein
MLPGSNGGIRVPVVYGVALARSNTVALPLADDDTDVCTGWSGVRRADRSTKGMAMFNPLDHKGIPSISNCGTGVS